MCRNDSVRLNSVQIRTDAAAITTVARESLGMGAIIVQLLFDLRMTK